MKTESIGRKRYMLTYICNQTVYFLSTKDEQFEKFKQFKSLYKVHMNKKIQGLQTDNGSEYISTEFSKYLEDNVIVHYTAVAYCPQSNRKAERLKQTLIEKARCTIKAAKVNYNFWPTAIDTANYIRNISPTSSLNGKTPFELFFNKIPSHKHLTIYGCEAYPFDLLKLSNKFAPGAKKNCIMVGYGESDIIYWIYDKSKKKMFVSSDDRFKEFSLE
jgi:hypothetical protein